MKKNSINKIFDSKNNFPVGNENFAKEDCTEILDRIINDENMKELFRSLSKK